MNTRELLEATITHEPPQRYDVDSLLARSRNRQRHRRFVATGSGFAVVAALVAVALTLPGAGAAPATVSDSTSAASTPPVTDGPPPLRGVTPTEPPAAAKLRLAVSMRDAVLAVAPEAVLGGPFTVEHQATDAYKVSDGWMGAEYWFGASQTISSAGRPGAIFVSVRRSSGYIACGEYYTEGTSCTVELGANRENIVIFTQVNPSGPERSVTVTLQREDGSQVEVGVSNALSLGSQPASYSGEDAPLTAAQVKAIALDPRITIYP